MSVKSLSSAEWCNTMMTEPMAHWWTQVSGAIFPEKSQAAHSLAFNNRVTLQLTCVKRRAVFCADVVSKLLHKQRKDW